MAFRSALIKFRIFWFLLGLSVAVSRIIWFESVLGLDITEGSFGIMANAGVNGISTRHGKSGDVDALADDDGGVFHTVTRHKRHRRSTGGTFQTQYKKETVCKISKDQFKKMSTDDKLVSLFEIMSQLGSVTTRVGELEEDVETILAHSMVTDKRLKLLEYKSIDQETRSRRNNLIFRGHPEVRYNDDCEAIIRNFLQRHLDIDPNLIRIQRAHRLGDLKYRPWGRAGGQRNAPRPIIVGFTEYKDVELIMANARKLAGKDFGINRDYPSEIVQARSRLWGEYKDEKAKCERDRTRRVVIGFPAKLVVNGKVIRDEFPEWKSILRETRTQHSQTKNQQTSNVQIGPRVSTGRDRASRNLSAMGAYTVGAMNSSQPKPQPLYDGSDSDGASVMETENSASTVVSSDNEILHTGVIAQSQHPSQLQDSGDTVNSTPVQNRYSALAHETGDSDVPPVVHQAADEYSEAMQQLLERVSDSNPSQTPGTSGQNIDNNA